MSYFNLRLGNVDPRVYSSMYDNSVMPLRQKPAPAKPGIEDQINMLHADARLAAAQADKQEKEAMRQSIAAERAATRAAMLKAQAEEASIAAQAAELAKASVKAEIVDQQQFVKGLLIGFIAAVLLI